MILILYYGKGPTHGAPNVFKWKFINIIEECKYTQFNAIPSFIQISLDAILVMRQ